MTSHGTSDELLEDKPDATPEDSGVFSPNLAHLRMAEDWPLIDALCGTTRRMREESLAWLPRYEAEEQRDYEVRVSRSFLFDAFADTVDKIQRRPFAKQVEIKGEALPEELAPIETNADMAGSDISAFAQELLKSAVKYGVAHVFVDFPAVRRNASRRFEVSNRVHPFFVLVTAKQLLGWTTEKEINGQERLTSIRWSWRRTERIGEYGEQEVDMVREVFAPIASPVAIGPVMPGQVSPFVQASANQEALVQFLNGRITYDEFITGPVVTLDLDGESEALTVKADPGIPGRWAVWRLDPEDEVPVLEDTGIHTYPGMPFRTLYTDKRGFMEGRCPLMPLAWTNLAHFQSSSDQNSILAAARLPVPFGRGFSAQQVKEGIVLSTRRAILTTDPNADFGWRGAPAEPIEFGKDHLEALEDRMEIQGHSPFMRNRGNVTLGGQRLDESKHHSAVQSWIIDEEQLLEQAYEMAARWMNARDLERVKLPEGFSVEIFKDFEVALGGDDKTLTELRGMQKDGQLSRRTLLQEAKRRGKLSEDVVVDEELERIRVEAEDAASMFGLTDAGGGDDGEDDPPLDDSGDPTEDDDPADDPSGDDDQ